MSLNKTKCLLELRSLIEVPEYTSKNIGGKTYVATMLKNIEDLGFTFSEKLIKRLWVLSIDDVTSIYKSVVPILKEMKGANVKHKPMYVNFPEQVMEASDAELYINAIVHYISVAFGSVILTEHERQERFPLIGNYNLKVIDIAGADEYANTIKNLMASKITLSEVQKSYVKNYYDDNKSSFIISEMPNKENRAYVAAILYADNNLSGLKGVLTTPTDVLRFVVALSDGDISLVENTKFKKFKRSERRLLMKLLESMGSKGLTYLEENMVKYRGNWIRLAEILHPGEFNMSCPKAYRAFSTLRSNKTIETFNSKVENLFESKKYLDCASLLSQHPTELARRLDSLLRKSKKKDAIVKTFKSIASDVSTNVLLNVKSHFLGRTKKSDSRIFFPKGAIAKFKVIDSNIKPLDEATCSKIVSVVEKTLIKRFSTDSKLGNVFIDDKLKTVNVPFALRSASHSFKTIARGSRVKIDGDKKTIRLFTYWKNGLKPGVALRADGYGAWDDGDRIDIDLSVIFLDDKFEGSGQVSWTRLREEDNLSVHSGDITSAPNGASEFIDINISKALSSGHRYAAANIYCYTGQNFADMNECFAGVMLRNDFKSGEIYDAKTVEHKFDLTAMGVASIPMLFDLKTREIIWVDLSMKDRASHFSRTVHGNQKSMSALVQGIVEMKKPTMYDLLTLHAKGRGKIVKNKALAKNVYDLKYVIDNVPEILTLI